MKLAEAGVRGCMAKHATTELKIYLPFSKCCCHIIVCVEATCLLWKSITTVHVKTVQSFPSLKPLASSGTSYPTESKTRNALSVATG